MNVSYYRGYYKSVTGPERVTRWGTLGTPEEKIVDGENTSVVEMVDLPSSDVSEVTVSLRRNKCDSFLSNLNGNITI